MSGIEKEQPCAAAPGDCRSGGDAPVSQGNLPGPGEGGTLLSLENICYSYIPGRPVLENVCLSVRKGQQIGLYGANGSGKTTLFRVITGLAPARSGRIFLSGNPVKNAKDFCLLRRHVGFVLQSAEDQLFCPTVLEDVAFGPLNLGLSPHDARERALETLSLVGMEHAGESLTHRLSGGEKRLVALASVLAMRPDLLLLDEPTTGLDPDACHRLMHILQSLKTARIVISHNWDFLRHISSGFLTIVDKKIAPAAPGEPHTHTHIHPLGNVAHHHDE